MLWVDGENWLGSESTTRWAGVYRNCWKYCTNNCRIVDMNVWFNKFDKDTGYRGGAATNMVEEFEECGLSKNTMYTIRATKVSLASLMPSVAGF